VVNMLVPFALAEVSLHFFLKKRNGFWLCMLSIPFVKVLLDGGTINSIIVGVGICVVVFSLYLVLDFFGIRIKTIENIRIRIFRKPRYEKGQENLEEERG